jgi:phosphatidylinositol alpha-1,6-mannosyltransferase
LRFGAAIAARQAAGGCPWVFYSHLSLARVQEFVPKMSAAPYGIFLHGIEAWRDLSATQRRVLEGASLRLANSAYTITRLQAAHPWLGPVWECPLAIHIESAQVTPATAKIGPPTVLIVARMSAEERYKGHDQLLEAWPAVRSRIPGARLVVIGEGDDVERLRGKAGRLGLGAHVFFTGFVDDAELEVWYREASLLAMPSREEGFGLVYLEAMARGIPCIGSVHDAAGSVIEDGVTGCLVDQSDSLGMARTISRLLADQSLRQRMGAEARRRVEANFTYSRFRHRLLMQIRNAFGEGELMHARTPRPAADAPPRS